VDSKLLVVLGNPTMSELNRIRPELTSVSSQILGSEGVASKSKGVAGV